MKLPYWLGHRMFRAIADGFFRYRVIGRERLQIPGGALLVCNHASFVDPPMVGIALDEDIYYLARKSLMSNAVVKAVYLAWNSIPVDQDRPDMTGLKNIVRLLKADEKVLIFPEGARTLTGEMERGEPGVGLIVAKSGVPVIPCRLFGTYEALPRGGKMIHPSEVTLVVGNTWNYDPANYKETGKELYQRISDDLMAEIAALTL
jgi:1-acyl-sn-glycerol-3-phosphate acyltransferase